MLNRLFGKKEEPKPEETPKVIAPKVIETAKGLIMAQKPIGATGVAIGIKEKVKEGEKWLKHVTTGDMAKYHALYTATRKNPKTGLDEKVTVCTEVDCEKNKPQ
jgi:hypothetical protein